MRVKRLFLLPIFIFSLVNISFGEDNPYRELSPEKLSEESRNLSNLYTNINNQLNQSELYKKVCEECKEKKRITGARGLLGSVFVGVIVGVVMKNGYIGVVSSTGGGVLTFHYVSKDEVECIKNGLKENTIVSGLFNNYLTVLNQLSAVSDEVGRRNKNYENRFINRK